MYKYNKYTLFKFINYIRNYEESLVDIIKLNLIPGDNDYNFKINENVKKITYEVSDHEHNYEYDTFLKKKYKQIYCPCYFNRKHKIFNNMKKRKLCTIVTIKTLEYNTETFEKEYTIGFYIDNVFYYEETCKEDELEKLQ
jgi:hypothetical protein